MSFNHNLDLVEIETVNIHRNKQNQFSIDSRLGLVNEVFVDVYGF